MPEPIESQVDLDALDKQERLDRMRHSAAHVLAEAMVAIMPEAELGIGPPIDTGFYYDFRLPRPLTEDDLRKLEKRMKKSIQRKSYFKMASITRAEAEETWANQPFKLDLLAEIEDGNITQCTHANFTDLCRGGHINNTGEIPAFKLISIAGAYWRGDEKNPQLTRVYGALFETQEELDAWEEAQEEARRRDHRRIGKDLGLFAFSEDIGPGIPLFLPKGATVRHEMESFVRELQVERGYQHVWTGNVAKGQLYEKSGHLANYVDSMFPAMADGDQDYFLKPMNCPSHMTLFNAQPHSYRDLPFRMAEFSTLHRFEKSGEVHGLTRVRSLTQDDSHIFCTPDQLQDELMGVFDLIKHVMGVYGFTDYRLAFSLPGTEGKYVDAPEKWDQAIEVLRAALDASGIPYTEEEGEAAFYGPKADFITKDLLGREWQLSTIQVDLIQPERLGCTYIGEDGDHHTPIVVHRAIIGTTERFLGVLIEHIEGNFPTWLAPVQAVLIPIADRHIDFCNEVAAKMRARGLRAEVDERSERMNAKIRDHQLQKVPYMLVVGDREQEANEVAVRVRGGEDEGATDVDTFINRLAEERDSRVLTP